MYDVSRNTFFSSFLIGGTGKGEPVPPLDFGGQNGTPKGDLDHDACSSELPGGAALVNPKPTSTNGLLILTPMAFTGIVPVIS